MRPSKYVQNVLLGASALVFAGAQFSPDRNESGPVLTAAVAFVSPRPDSLGARADNGVAAITKAALAAFTGVVRPLSRPEALEDAFRSYFAYKTSHPNEVRK